MVILLEVGKHAKVRKDWQKCGQFFNLCTTVSASWVIHAGCQHNHSAMNVLIMVLSMNKTTFLNLGGLLSVYLMALGKVIWTEDTKYLAHK